MHLNQWHRCRRWNEQGFLCPYRAFEPDDPDDDREHEELERRDAAERAGELFDPAFPISRGLKEVRREPLKFPTPVKKPSKEVRTPAVPPPERKAAISTKGGPTTKWLKEWEKQLNAARVQADLARVFAPTSSKVPGSQPVRSLSTNVQTASVSETALTRSLNTLPHTARPWDTGAARTPQTVTAGRQRDTGNTRRRISSNRGAPPSGDWNKWVRFGAGIGAAVLTAKGIDVVQSYRAGPKGPSAGGGYTGPSAAQALIGPKVALQN